MNFIKYIFALMSVVFATGTAVRAWDLGVVTSEQIQFLRNKVEENTMEHNDLKNMGAIAYDPISNDVYVSVAHHKRVSIFRIKTTGEKAYINTEPIVAKQKFDIQSMAYDYRSSSLYWTTGRGHTINYVNVREKNNSKDLLVGNILLMFNNSEIPMGIAIDTYRKYLYWTNCNHLNATIERLYLDWPAERSNCTIVVQKDLFQPLSIVVDEKNTLIYWSDEHQGLYYSIESSDLDGGSRRVLIYDMHHQPFSIALDKWNIYWSDWTNNAVWMIPKNSSTGVERPSLVAKYNMINPPMGLITPNSKLMLQ